MKTTIVVIVALFALAACTKNDETPAALTADFTLPQNAETQTALTFENLSQNATRYKWTFGDNSAAVMETAPQHRFVARGTYPITLTVYRNADSLVVTKTLWVKPYDSFAHAGIPVTSTYITRGRKHERFVNPGSGATTSYRITPLPDLTLNVTRISPDSVSVNGRLAIVQAGSTNTFNVRGFSGPDANILTIYTAGDSIALDEYSHLGHGYFRTDRHAGPRQL